MHADGERDGHVIEAESLAIRDGSVGEERGETGMARHEERRLAPHVQEAVLLTREARFRQVLGRGAAADGDRDVRDAHFLTQLAVRAPNRLLDRVRKGHGEDGVADPPPRSRGAARRVAGVLEELPGFGR